MFGLAGSAEFQNEYLMFFCVQLLLDMRFPRPIGCSRGCGMSSCSHAGEAIPNKCEQHHHNICKNRHASTTWPPKHQVSTTEMSLPGPLCSGSVCITAWGKQQVGGLKYSMEMACTHRDIPRGSTDSKTAQGDGMEGAKLGLGRKTIIFVSPCFLFAKPTRPTCWQCPRYNPTLNNQSGDAVHQTDCMASSKGLNP